MISLQIKVGAEQVKAKANELDKALRIFYLFLVLFFYFLPIPQCLFDGGQTSQRLQVW